MEMEEPQPRSLSFGISKILADDTGSDKKPNLSPAIQQQLPSVSAANAPAVGVARNPTEFWRLAALGLQGGTLSRFFENFLPRSSILDVVSAWTPLAFRTESAVGTVPFIRRSGHPYQSRTPPKRKKPRTSFTRSQILELEKRFHQQKYLASAERSVIASSLRMTDAQVKTWFQNRRTKWRRQTIEERESERQAAARFMLRDRDMGDVNDEEADDQQIVDKSNSRSLINKNLEALSCLRPWCERNDSIIDNETVFNDIK